MNGVTILFVYAVIMILATVILTKKEKNVERFCVGSRSENWLMSALSIAATWIWAPALFVSTEKAYSTGWVGLFWFLVPNALCLVIFIPFAKKIRKEMPEGMTLSGYMKEKYKSDGVKRVYLFQLIGLSVLSTGVQLLAGSQILSAVTGNSFKAMTILLACIAISYSLFSGIKASMLTDAIQMVFMLVACSLFVIFGVRNTGTQGIIQGLSGISGDCTTLFSGKGVEIFLAFGLPTTIGLLSGPFGDQSFWQRAFAVKKEKLGRAFLLGAVLFAAIPLSMGILGFMGAGAGYQAQNLGIINFELIRHFFPSWAVLPFLFMIVSGLLSTVDTPENLLDHADEDVHSRESTEKALAEAQRKLITFMEENPDVENDTADADASIPNMEELQISEKNIQEQIDNIDEKLRNLRQERDSIRRLVENIPVWEDRMARLKIEEENAEKKMCSYRTDNVLIEPS